MWPRIISQLEQLAELLPYLKHIVPLADKFLASKSANDAAVNALVEGVRSDLARLAPANADLAGQLGDLSTKVNSLASITEQTRTLTEDTRTLTTSLGNGILALERQIRSLRALLITALALVAILTLMTAWLLVTHTR